MQAEPHGQTVAPTQIADPVQSLDVQHFPGCCGGNLQTWFTHSIAAKPPQSEAVWQHADGTHLPGCRVHALGH